MDAVWSIGRWTQDHEVTAFSRHPYVLKLTHRNLYRQAGDVLHPDDVKAAVCGHDAALIALGAGRNGTVRSMGTRNIIDAMREEGPRRLVCETTLGVGDSRALLNFFWKRIMFGLLLRSAYAGPVEQEAIIQQSDLDWVIMRPGAFIDRPATGRYKHGFPVTEKNLTLKIARADVADFMLRQLTDDTHLHRTPSLSY